MYARSTTVRFHPGAADEALGILRDAILPQTCQQSGFQGMLVMRAGEDHGHIITFWETEKDLLASRPPSAIASQVARLGELVEVSQQDTYEVLLCQVSPAGSTQDGSM